MQRSGNVDHRAHADMRGPCGLVGIGKDGDLLPFVNASGAAKVGQDGIGGAGGGVGGRLRR